MVTFWNNFTECSLGDPFQKLSVKFWSIHKHGSGEWGLRALYGHGEILKKSSLKPLVLFGNNFMGTFLSKSPLWNFDPSINMALVNEGFLHSTGMKKFLKYLLLRNRSSDFEIISQKCSLSDLSQKLLEKFWSVIKHGSCEWGLLSLYRHKQILKKSSSLKPLLRFWNNFIGLFLGWPFSKTVCKISIFQ